MINDRETAKMVLGGMFEDLDTPAPWDVDEESLKWAYIWGEFGEHGLGCNVDGTYTVSMDEGEYVDTFPGVIQALACVRWYTGTHKATN